MRWGLRSLGRIAAVFSLGAASACTQSPSAPMTGEVINWWSKQGEAKALDQLFDLFAQLHPDQDFEHSPVDNSTVARDTIEERMVSGWPPESFQANGGWDLLSWVVYNGTDDSESKMETIDDLAAAWQAQIPAPVLQEVTCNDHVYGVPLDIHRLNTLFFNRGLFAESGLAPPTTLDDLFTDADVLQANGVRPLALGTKDPWTVALLLFENLLVAHGGGAYYRDFFAGKGDPTGPEMTGAVTDLVRLLSLTNADRQARSWDQAVDLVVSGQAAMTIMGDWTKGYLDPTDDVGEVVMPGTSGAFVFTTDTFGLPKGARNRPGARELLQLMGTKQGQYTFNPPKGSIAPLSYTDTTVYDSGALETIADFRDAAAGDRLVAATSMVARPEFMDEIDAVLGDLADSTDPEVAGNPSIVLYTLRNWYDQLRPGYCQP
jgi:glucose/mannose transport system substrate-binding protein